MRKCWCERENHSDDSWLFFNGSVDLVDFSNFRTSHALKQNCLSGEDSQILGRHESYIKLFDITVG